MVTRWGSARVCTLVACAALVLAACGGAKGGAANSSGSTATAGTSPIPAGSTAQAILTADKSCKPTPGDGTQPYWLVAAGDTAPTYTLPKASPKVGTSLSGWPTTPMVELGDCQNTESWVFGAGDATNFYLAVEVATTLPEVDGTDAAPWSGDSIQFAFDPQDEQTSGSYGPNDMEMGMILLGSEQFLFENVVAGAAITPIAIPNGQTSITRNNGITLYEASIPWAQIGSTVAPTFGFNVVVAAGGPPYAAPYGYEWTQGIIEGKSPSDFAQVTFKH